MALKKRVEVLFEEGQYDKLENIALARGESVGALIRQAVEHQYLRPTTAAKGAAVKEFLSLEMPVGTWEEVKEALVRQRSGPIETS